jgi:hypothetical protein
MIDPTVESPTAEHLREMVRLIGGYRVSQAIFVLVELGIVDLFDNEPMAVDELARTTQVHEESLFRVLRFLAGVGIVAETSHRCFDITPLGSALKSRVPGTPAANIRNWLHEAQWTSWGQLLTCVRTGRTAFDDLHGMTLFDFLQRHPDAGLRFDVAMTANTARDGLALCESYDFCRIDTLVDVGGGHGRLLASLLAANPAMRGVLFDRPRVVAGAKSVLANAGVLDRCEIIAGDFFEGVPPHASAYLLSRIIHDWDDARAVRILQNCRLAGAGTAKVLIFDRLVAPDHTAGLPVLHIDLEMMVNLGGLERTKDQFNSLLTAAGFTVSRIVPIAGTGHAIIEAVPT